ncbi:hypothetical protein DOTSEDRAFT_25496 [Dothistroma septosporum NZE10]|uniref:Uncharacterized protein n=1 Tax=Dothistroma septosporum (strain NZE10 / CBS 128990) TaxID=675120 RepID=M2YNI5_DOTSN|nr:hypothetical protein DOTSEDRAFT_25496 [Dothistroma septosporum NZE10]
MSSEETCRLIAEALRDSRETLHVLYELPPQEVANFIRAFHANDLSRIAAITKVTAIDLRHVGILQQEKLLERYSLEAIQGAVDWLHGFHKSGSRTSLPAAETTLDGVSSNRGSSGSSVYTDQTHRSSTRSASTTSTAPPLLHDTLSRPGSQAPPPVAHGAEHDAELATAVQPAEHHSRPAPPSSIACETCGQAFVPKQGENGEAASKREKNKHQVGYRNRCLEQSAVISLISLCGLDATTILDVSDLVRKYLMALSQRPEQLSSQLLQVSITLLQTSNAFAAACHRALSEASVNNMHQRLLKARGQAEVRVTLLMTKLQRAILHCLTHYLAADHIADAQEPQHQDLDNIIDDYHDLAPPDTPLSRRTYDALLADQSAFDPDQFDPRNTL